MDIPETIDNFLKPLLIAQPVDKKQLPENLPRQLDSIISHFQNKRGNVILFIGGSATENVLAATLLAKKLGKDVYRLDLLDSASRHLGETEKHLLQVFEFAAQHSFVLLIDEADSLFSKRAGNRSADDRLANLEIAYLLKRIAAYPGMVVFTTNAHDKLDDSLLRAVPWQINLSHHASRRLSWWQRIFGISSKR